MCVSSRTPDFESCRKRLKGVSVWAGLERLAEPKAGCKDVPVSAGEFQAMEKRGLRAGGRFAPPAGIADSRSNGNGRNSGPGAFVLGR